MCGIDQAMQRSNQPIPCSTFNHDGTIFAYGVSMFLPLNCMANYRILKIADTIFLKICTKLFLYIRLFYSQLQFSMKRATL